jgi:hypothetical protein
MPKFLLTFRSPREYSEGSNDHDAWMRWFGEIQGNLVEIGDGVGEAVRVGNVDGGQRVGGYTVIQAADIGAAAELAKSSPPVAAGYGVEIGQLLEVAVAA